MKQNLFITLEGGEGSGKTTLIQQLFDALKSKGHSVIKTREPGGTSLGEEIRHWLLSDQNKISICDKAELLLFLAGRAQHILEVISPALENNSIVLCDRFNDSTIAYQGVGRRIGFDEVKQLCTIVCGKVVPGLTIYLDIPPHIGLQRSRKMHKETAGVGELDRIENEKLNFHEEVRQAFLLLAKQDKHRIVVIDATMPQESVFKNALKHVEKLLGR